MKLWRSIWRRTSPINRQDIDAALSQFGSIDSEIILVHSSLSACGHVRGGERTVVDALEAWPGMSTLVMPTHTYCYPDEGKAAPCFQVDKTGSVVGAITDFFWRQPNVIRSLHPTHSLACKGARARELCTGHERTHTPCGIGTPYEQLVKGDCAVLMFGVSLEAYTLFHTAEDAANVPYLYEHQQSLLRIKTSDGVVKPFSMLRQDMRIPRRFSDMDQWLEAKGLLQRCRLGHGELLFLPHAAEVHRILVKSLRNDPFFLIADTVRKELEA
jgi:aminoglycoside 3-N-acetyltransferase